MRRLTVDRIDGIYAICEDKDRKMFALPVAELPRKVRSGDKLDIDDEGVITINADATASARAEVRAAEDALFQGDAD